MIYIKDILTIILVLVTLCAAMGQTCCSGGVPLSSSLGMPYAENKTLQIGIGWNFNNLNTLKNGSETVGDSNRKRTTHSFISQIGYTFFPRLSADILVSVVRQSRVITNNNNQVDTDNTFGLGDLAF